MSNNLTPPNNLLQEIRQLIESAKQRAAEAINTEITQLYWQIGKSIQTEILQNQRAEYGKQVIATLSQQLTQAYGKGWSERQLRHCIHFAQTFPNEQIVSTLRRQFENLALSLQSGDNALVAFHSNRYRMLYLTVRQVLLQFAYHTRHAHFAIFHYLLLTNDLY